MAPYRQPQSATDISCLRVLVLEDQTFQRNLLIGLLNSLGVTCITAVADGPSGLDALDKSVREFDVALCDLKMEGMDGIEFIRLAVQRNVASFILTSAIDTTLLATAETVIRGFGTRLMGVLSKPVEVKRLQDMLVDCLNHKNDAQLRKSARTSPTFCLDQIRAALDNKEFVPFYQPQIDLTTGMAVGVEMLARWAHPSLGILAPGAFISLMEQAGLIDRLGDVIFAKALNDINCMSRAGFDISMALNLSPLTLQNTDMPKHLGALVRQYGVEPSRITIEVTETAIAESPANLMESLTRLRMQGFEIAVDDFGVGYSSLLQLSEMPFTEIKVDRTFVSGAAKNRKSMIIAEAIVQLAKKLDLRTVAEGIENEDELNFVQSLGCDACQGYYLAMPMSYDKLMEFLRAPTRRV